MKKSSVEVLAGQIWESQIMGIQFVVLDVGPNNVIAKTKNLAGGNKEILVHLGRFASGELVLKGCQRGRRAEYSTEIRAAAGKMQKTGRVAKEFTL